MLTYMIKIARAAEVAFADRANVVLSEMVEVFFAPRIPDHAIAIIASLTNCSVLSIAVMANQIVP